MTPSRFSVSAPKRVHVGQGEHFVTAEPEAVLFTVLGSCVAVCLRDPTLRIGGMNHFLLPAGRSDGVGEARLFGTHAMELLINDLLRHGGHRSGMEARLFGGAQVLAQQLNIGASNIAFAEKFLEDEGIKIVSRSVGGYKARRIQYWPASGRVQEGIVSDLQARDNRKQADSVRPEATGNLELF